LKISTFKECTQDNSSKIIYSQIGIAYADSSTKQHNSMNEDINVGTVYVYKFEKLRCL